MDITTPRTHPTLSPRVITDAALAIARDQGLAVVSIRKLATLLGVTPMAIYWHIPSKDALLDAMAASLFEDVPTRDDPTGAWPVRLRGLLESLLHAARMQPAIASLLSTRTVSSDAGLTTTEVMLDILRCAGFSPAEATQVARYAINSISNLVSAPPGMIDQQEPTDDRQARLDERSRYDHLSVTRYPRIVEAAAPLSEPIAPDAYDAFGLGLLLKGIEGMASEDQETA